MIVELKNMQSIEHAIYKLPETGIVQIKGGNSNGKSILFKAIGAVVTLSMMDTPKRKALIRRGQDSGEILIDHNGKALYVLLHQDRNKCLVMLKKDGEEEVVRTFRDGGIEELIRAFGFSCYSKNSICLQLYETFGPMPFVNTKDTENGEIVESVTEDAVAKRFMEAYKNFTHPKALEQVKSLNKQIDQLERTKQAIVMYDWRKYHEFHTKMKEYYNVMKFAMLLELPRVNVPPEVPNVEPLSLQIPKVNVLPRVEFTEVKPIRLVKPKVVYEPEFIHIESVSKLVGDMEQLLNGYCPTCGRQLVER